MNCFYHSDVPAVAFCRTCGKGLCAECKRVEKGTIFCGEHVPEATAKVNTAPAPAATAIAYDCSPALAFVLGLIPGVGAIYNAQYAKGLVHAVIFGLLVSIISSGEAHNMEPLFGILISVWIFYMALEAYHTAQKRRMGIPIDEFSSLVNMRGDRTGRFPTGAIVLICLGVVLLLNTLDVLQFRYLIRYWPVLLILLGLYMLYARLAPNDRPAGEHEVSHERQ